MSSKSEKGTSGWSARRWKKYYLIGGIVVALIVLVVVASVFIETPPPSVTEHPPRIEIQKPESGVVFAEAQGFLLEATGYDREDDELPSEAINWLSSIDGNLGTGWYLVLSAADLPLGTHTITLSVADSDQMTSTESIEITINDRNSLPVTNEDEAFGGLEKSIIIDVLANDIDVEGDFRRSSLRIERHPRLGTAEVVTTERGMPVIEYSPITGGEETFTYSICDGIYRCDTAEVTVIFPDCTITGTSGNDNLIGTSGDDVICGLDGNDVIDGKGGNDLIYAGFGEDTVYGRTGDDTIYGGPGNDIIYGGSGDDLISGHKGNDTIYGDFGDDTIWGGWGGDIIYGGSEADEVYGEAGNDTLYGSEGPDTIHGDLGDDTIYGGPGDDTIEGNEGADTIYANQISDIILELTAEDTVFHS